MARAKNLIALMIAATGMLAGSTMAGPGQIGTCGSENGGSEKSGSCEKSGGGSEKSCQEKADRSERLCNREGSGLLEKLRNAKECVEGFDVDCSNSKSDKKQIMAERAVSKAHAKEAKTAAQRAARENKKAEKAAQDASNTNAKAAKAAKTKSAPRPRIERPDRL